MSLKRNVVGWFEIPVTDMERALAFYKAVFGYEFQRMPMGPLDMALFPMEDLPGSAGALVKHDAYYKPSHDGVLIYFTAQSGDLKNELAKVEGAGGQVLQPKTQISEEYGYMALFEDTEGNRLGLHSNA